MSYDTKHLDLFMKDYEVNNGKASDIREIPLYEYNSRPNILCNEIYKKQDKETNHDD